MNNVHYAFLDILAIYFFVNLSFSQIMIKKSHKKNWFTVVSAIIPEMLMLKKLMDMRFELKPQQGVTDYINNLSMVTFFSS